MASIITERSGINNAKCMVAKNSLDSLRKGNQEHESKGAFRLNQKIPKTSNKEEWYVQKFPRK